VGCDGDDGARCVQQSLCMQPCTHLSLSLTRSLELNKLMAWHVHWRTHIRAHTESSHPRVHATPPSSFHRVCDELTRWAFSQLLPRL
jgi:hypothetical protein